MMLRSSSAKTKSAATRSPGVQNKRRQKARHRPAWDVCMNVCVNNRAFTAVIFRAVNFSDQLKSRSILVSDVTIIESKIEIEFFLEYRIE